MKYKNIFNYILSIICFISWSNLAVGQNKPQTTASKTNEKCDIQKLIDSTEVQKKESTLKLQSFDPKSKTVKNKIINDGVSTNIFLVKLFAAQESCKNSDADKKWIQTEIEKNTKQLKIYTNSYCKAVILPGNDLNTKNSVDSGEAEPDKDGGCKHNGERRMVKFVFDTCTPGSDDYDLKVCECHVKDRGNSCMYDKKVADKLIKKIEAIQEDPICDEKTPQSKSSFFDSKNMADIGKFVLAIAIAAGVIYVANKYFKKQDAKKSAEALATAGGGSAAGGSTGLPSSFQGKYSGSVDMSNHEDRIKARNIALTEMGKPITGNDAIDNAATGGGPPDGGIYMAGSFEFTVGANNTITSGQFIIHGYPLKLGGGKIESNGSFNINPEGLEVQGQLNGTTISGRANEYGKPHVYGTLNGVFTPSK